MFRHLSETEAAEFKQWAWDNWTPGDDINPGIHHPVVVAECQLIKAAADAWQHETRSDFYRAWDRQADRDDSDNHWSSFEHAGRMFDLCAYWTGGTLAVVVYECVRDPMTGNWNTDIDTGQHLPRECRLEKIRKTIQRKRSIQGLTKYEEQLEKRLENGEITDAEYRTLFPVLVDQAELIYKRMHNRSQ